MAVPFVTTLDDSAFTRGLRNMEKGVDKSTRSISGVFSKMSGAMKGAIGAGAFVAGAKSIANYASEINDLSESLGMSTDSFQEYSLAVEQSGANQKDFVRGMGSLISKMEDAKSGNESATSAFEKLGIGIDEIKSTRPETMILRIADALKKTGADGKSTAAAMDILGSKVGLKLVPALKKGSDAFLEMGKSAKKMSADTIKALEEGQDRFDRMVRSGKANIGNNLVNLWGGITGKVGPDPSLPATTPQEIAEGHAEVMRRRAARAGSPTSLGGRNSGVRTSFFRGSDPRSTLFGGAELMGPSMSGGSLGYAGGPGSKVNPFMNESQKNKWFSNQGFKEVMDRGRRAGLSDIDAAGFTPQSLDSFRAGSGKIIPSGRLNSGGLRTGGIASGGLTGIADGTITRRGDAARAKVETQESLLKRIATALDGKGG